MAVGDNMKVAIVFTADEAEGEMVVTMSYGQTNEPLVPSGLGDETDLAILIGEVMTDTYIDLLTNDTTIDRVDVFNIDKPTLDGTSAIGLAGTIADDTVGYRNTIISRNNTGLRGGSYTGYQSWIAPAKTQVFNGILDITFKGLMQGMADELLSVGTIIIDGVFLQIVYSPTLLIGSVVSSTLVRPQTGSLRSRASVKG